MAWASREPPGGFEPPTYALRVRRSDRTELRWHAAAATWLTLRIIPARVERAARARSPQRVTLGAGTAAKGVDGVENARHEEHQDTRQNLPEMVQPRWLAPRAPRVRNLPERVRQVATHPVVAASLASAATVAVQAGARALLPRALARQLPALRPGRPASPANPPTSTIVTRAVMVETIEVHTRQR